MSSACPQAAKNLFAESKRRLSDRVAVNVNNCASVARQIVRGSKSHDILMQSAKGLAQQEPVIESSAEKLRKIQLIQQQLNYQFDAVKEGAERLPQIREQVDSMER